MFALTLLLLAAVSARADIDIPYTVSADYIYFNVDKKVMESSGNVAFTYQDLRVYADHLRIDIKLHILEAEGSVRLVSVSAQNATSNTATENQVAEETESLREELESEKSGNRIVRHGDMLNLDIEYIQGMILQTTGTVEQRWFQGMSLNDSAPLTLRKGMFMDEEAYSEPMTSITARKMRIQPADKFEAWTAKVYVKSGKALSLPYYTNDAGKVTPGNWRLKNVKYSSNDNFSLGVAVRYSEKKGNRGFFNVTYKDKGSKHFGIGLDQQITLGQRTSGMLNISNLGTDSSSIGLTINKFTRSNKTHNLSLRYDNSGMENLNYNLSARVGGQTLNGYVQGNWDHKSGYGMLTSSFSLSPKMKYYGPKRKLSTSVSYSAGYNDYQTSEPEASAFVGLSVNRTGWTLGPRGSISANLNTGYGMTTEGDTRTNFATSVSMNRNLGKTSMITMAYRYRQDMSSGLDERDSSSVSAALSLGPGAKWSTQLSTAYDLKDAEFSSVQATLNFTFNKKARFATTASYDLQNDLFTTSVFHFYYTFYGSTMNFHWYKETNNFMVDFISKTR